MTTAKGAERRRLPGLTVDEGYTRHPFDEKFGVRTSAGRGKALAERPPA